MKTDTTYIPNDLGYSASGYPMEREKFNAMVKEIFDKGRVTEVHVHSYGQMRPGEEIRRYFEFSKAITVVINEPIEITYCIHINKLNPIRIIEAI